MSTSIRILAPEAVGQYAPPGSVCLSVCWEGIETYRHYLSIDAAEAISTDLMRTVRCLRGEITLPVVGSGGLRSLCGSSPAAETTEVETRCDATENGEHGGRRCVLPASHPAPDRHNYNQ